MKEVNASSRQCTKPAGQDEPSHTRAEVVRFACELVGALPGLTMARRHAIAQDLTARLLTMGPKTADDAAEDLDRIRRLAVVIDAGGTPGAGELRGLVEQIVVSDPRTQAPQTLWLVDARLQAELARIATRRATPHPPSVGRCPPAGVKGSRPPPPASATPARGA